MHHHDWQLRTHTSLGGICRQLHLARGKAATICLPPRSAQRTYSACGCCCTSLRSFPFPRDSAESVRAAARHAHCSQASLLASSCVRRVFLYARVVLHYAHDGARTHLPSLLSQPLHPAPPLSLAMVIQMAWRWCYQSVCLFQRRERDLHRRFRAHLALATSRSRAGAPRGEQQARIGRCPYS